MEEPGCITATRSAYDAIAEGCAEAFREPLANAPLDRTLLTGFAEQIRRDHADPRILEVGSGPGDITAHLHQLELDASGLDLSSSMVALVRRAYPEDVNLSWPW